MGPAARTTNPSTAPVKFAPGPAASPASLDWGALATTGYLVVAGTMLARVAKLCALRQTWTPAFAGVTQTVMPTQLGIQDGAALIRQSVAPYAKHGPPPSRG